MKKKEEEFLKKFGTDRREMLDARLEGEFQRQIRELQDTKNELQQEYEKKSQEIETLQKQMYDLMDEIYYTQEKLEDDLILDEEKIKFAKDFLRKMFHEIHETINEKR